MKYQTITKLKLIERGRKWQENGRTYLAFEKFFTEREALHHAKEECHYFDFVIESLVLDATNEVLHQVRKGDVFVNGKKVK